MTNDIRSLRGGRAAALILLLVGASIAPPLADVSAAQCQPPGAACDDGNPCTTGDICSGGGTCTGTVTNCDDANPCTDEVCDVDLGCVYADNSAGCSDGNACTTSDVCRGGTCVGGAPAAGCSVCEAATTIPADGGSFTGTTSGANTLAGSCGQTQYSPERVYRWTPTSSGVATIQTCGNGTLYDTVVYVRGTSCTGSEIGCNDDTTGCATGEPSSAHGSRVTPTVTAGETYYIVVDGYFGRSGAYALTVSPPSLCGNGVREGVEECDGAAVAGCPSGQCRASCLCAPPDAGLPDLVPTISDVRVDFETTVAGGDVVEGCAEATSGVDLLRFGVLSSNIGTADFVLGNPMCPSPCDEHPLEVCGNPEFTCSPAEGHNHAHYSSYARYDLLDASGEALVVGHKQGFCLRDTTCADQVYTCSNQGISAGCGDLYAATLGCQYIDITGVPSGNYTLRVTLDPFGRVAELSTANNVAQQAVVIERGGPTPSATATGGATASRTLTPTRTATPTIPTPTRTATPSRTATIGTTGTPGTASPGFTRTPTRTPTPSRTPSRTPTATGTPGGSTGTCASPVVVPASGGTFTGTTSGSSSQSGSCENTSAAPERVFAWTPATSGVATIQTCSSTATSFDTVLYIRSGSCASGTEVACNDDTAGCFTSEPDDHHGSRVTPVVTAGQTYFIVVDGYNGRRGDFALTITPPSGGGATITATASRTPTVAATATRTPTAAPSRTPTGAPSPTRTASRTPTPAASRTPTATLSRTPTPASSRTPTSTAVAPTATGGIATRTATPANPSATRTATPASPTPTATPGTGGCGAPVVIPASGGTFTRTTSGGSTLAGSCATSGNSPEAVFQWTPNRSGSASIRTCGSATTFDTVAYVRSGSCLSGAEIACNDDTTNCQTGEPSPHHGSSIDLTVSAGQTYFVVVDGYNGAAGTFALSVVPPP